MLTALGERDTGIAATEQRAGKVLQTVITYDHVTISEAFQWSTGAISRLEAIRLRHLAGPCHNPSTEDHTIPTNVRCVPGRSQDKAQVYRTTSIDSICT